MKDNILKNEKFRIIKENWRSPEGDLFIYRIHPLKPTSKIKKHPKYKTYSVFSEQEFPVNYDVNADLSSRRSKDGSMRYDIVRLNQTFPDTAKGQWDYLERLSTNQNFKRVYNELTKYYENNVKILDIIMEDSFKFEQISDNQSFKVRGEKLKETIRKFKNSSLFLESLHPDVADLITDSQAEKLSQISGSPVKSADIFQKDPFSGMRMDGLGFKTLDNIRAQLQNLFSGQANYQKEYPIRMYYGAYDVLRDATQNNGDTFVFLDEFKRLLINTLQVPTDTIEGFLKDGLHKAELRTYPEFKLYIKDQYVTTYNLWTAENNIYDYLTNDYDITPYSNFESKKKDYLERNNLNLTEEQESIFDLVNKNKNVLVVGLGGAGKTFTVSHLIRFLSDDLDKRVLLVAPTGKAAQVLSNYTNMPASTIHKAFGLTPSNPRGSYDGGHDILVIDEYSMVDSELQSYVFELIKKYPQMRVVLVGDEYQLPSVGPGNLLHVYIKNKIVPTVKLEKVFRINNQEGGIARLTREFRSGFYSGTDKDYPVNETVRSDEDLVVRNQPNNDDIVNQAINAYDYYLNNKKASVDDIMVLTPVNARKSGQVPLNIAIQEFLREREGKTPLEFSLSRTSHNNIINFYKNDRVMFTQNSELIKFDSEKQLKDILSIDFNNMKKDMVNNGDTGIIRAVSEDGFAIQLTDRDSMVYVSADEASLLELGYARTIHKSQGSEFPYGIGVISSADSFILNANSLYTLVTRFKEDFHLIADLKTVRRRVGHFINKNRRSILEELIVQENIVF